MTHGEQQHVTSYRRYCLLERFAAYRDQRCAIGDVFLAKQKAEPGTPLPDDFPSRAALLKAGYLAIEDLIGADAEELLCNVCLNPKQVGEVLSALPAS